jgi:hypothetical protein
MAMERVTIEQNGERFTLDVPEGTSDADIQKFVASQQGGGQPNQMMQAPPSPAENIAGQAAIAATPAAVNAAANAATSFLKMPLDTVPKFLTQPLTSARNVAQFVSNSIPMVEGAIAPTAANPIVAQTAPRVMNVGEGLMAGGSKILGQLASPANLFTLPYNMAAYEQAKIRANPNAPGLENNPYAMVQRGQAPTQGAAGAMNQRSALVNMPYGNVNAQEKLMLDQHRANQINMMMRYAAAKRVLGQQQ